MSVTEAPLFANLIKDNSLITRFDPVVDIARQHLPEPVKAGLKKLLNKETKSYPIYDPIVKELAGLEANFWITTQSDWNRIISNGYEGAYGEEVIRSLRGMDSPVFYDAGAAQGLYTIFAAKAGARVYAFDPDPLSQKAFAGNLLLNPEVDDAIQYYGVALGNEQRMMELHFDRRGVYAPSLMKTSKGLSDTTEVQMVTLDQLVSEGVIPIPNVVKMDIEGAECLALKGANGVLSTPDGPSDIFLEIHEKYLGKFGSSLADVVESLRQTGYVDLTAVQRRAEYLCHFKKI